MNLFENLQILNESSTSIYDELIKYLKEEDAYNSIYEICYTANNKIEFTIYNGDWRHDHIFVKDAINKFFNEKNVKYEIISVNIDDEEPNLFSDTYSATYTISFDEEDKSNNLIESNNEEVDLSEYKDLEHDNGVDIHWNLYRKIIDGKGVWAAKNQKTGEVRKITYNQARGIDPIEELSNIKKLSRNLGKRLLSTECNESKVDSSEQIIESNKFKYCVYDDNTNNYSNHDSFDNLRDAVKYSINKAMKSAGYTFTVSLNSNSIFLVTVLYFSTHCKLCTNVGNFNITLSDDRYTFNEVDESILNKILNKIELNNDIDELEENHHCSKEIDNEKYIRIETVINNKLQETNENNVSINLNKLKSEIEESTYNFMTSVGFPIDEAKDYFVVEVTKTREHIVINVGAELSYSPLSKLCDELNKIINKYDKTSYFEPECPGRIVAYLFINDEEILIETNNANVVDTDYETGEKLFNEIKEYLNSVNVINNNGNDTNWQPSDFNASNLEPDGEIYLINNANILFYPYINKWSDDEFKVIVNNYEEMNLEDISEIKKIFNKYNKIKWNLIFQ